MVEKRDCPVCCSQQKRCLYNQRFSSLSGHFQLTGYDVVTCNDCGFAYADNIPDQEWFDSYYYNVSKYTYDHRAGKASPVDRARFKNITHMISNHLPDRKIHILDFGCATGSLLNYLKEAGYVNLLGMDKSPAAAKVAQKLYSIPVVNTSIQSIECCEKPFDLLILSGVLEHVRDIRNMLLEMSSVLRKNGLVYIEVPDVIGFVECMDTPFQEFSVEHINYFSKHSLINLMSQHGFEPVEVLRLTRDYTSNTKMPLLCGFFRLTGKKNKNVTFDKETIPALQIYIETSLEKEKHISEIIDRLVASNVPLVVWGVGTFTLHLIKNTEFSELNIIAFADSNRNYQNQFLLGRPILAPSELKGYPQPILISSYAFKTEIEEQIRKKLGLQNDLITLKVIS